MPSTVAPRSAAPSRATGALLWTLQSLLAAVFVFAGVAKLAMPLAPVARMTGLPVAFLRFIAIAELLGALGLVLPGVLRIRPALTPLAAAGLVGIMTGATVITAMTQGMAPAIIPLVVGLFLTLVVLGRRPACAVAARAARSTQVRETARGGLPTRARKETAPCVS